MRFAKLSTIAIIELSATVYISCRTATATEHNFQKIRRIDINIHNFTEAPSTSNETKPVPCLGLKCTIHLQNKFMARDELEYCIISHNTRKDYLFFSDLKDSFNPRDAIIGKGLILRDNSLSNSLTVISNESPAIRLKLTSQPSSHHIPLVLIPADSAQQYKYLINEDAPAIFKESSLQVLRRPAILHAESKPEGFILTFSINDPKASTGSVFFHDKNNTLVGRHHEMLVSDSGAISQELNGGKAFFTDGTPNILRIHPSVILFEEKKSLYDINHAYIALKTKTVTTAEVPLQTITQNSTSDAMIVFPYLVKPRTESQKKEVTQ